MITTFSVCLNWQQGVLCLDRTIQICMNTHRIYRRQQIHIYKCCCWVESVDYMPFAINKCGFYTTSVCHPSLSYNNLSVDVSPTSFKNTLTKTNLFPDTSKCFQPAVIFITLRVVPTIPHRKLWRACVSLLHGVGGLVHSYRVSKKQTRTLIAPSIWNFCKIIMQV